MTVADRFDVTPLKIRQNIDGSILCVYQITRVPSTTLFETESI
jgi:hypothetical protein